MRLPVKVSFSLNSDSGSCESRALKPEKCHPLRGTKGIPALAPLGSFPETQRSGHNTYLVCRDGSLCQLGVAGSKGRRKWTNLPWAKASQNSEAVSCQLSHSVGLRELGGETLKYYDLITIICYDYGSSTWPALRPSWTQAHAPGGQAAPHQATLGECFPLLCQWYMRRRSNIHGWASPTSSLAPSVR